jgi:hypothetical protein
MAAEYMALKVLRVAALMFLGGLLNLQLSAQEAYVFGLARQPASAQFFAQPHRIHGIARSRAKFTAQQKFPNSSHCCSSEFISLGTTISR